MENREKWFEPWLKLIGGLVVIIGLISGAIFGLKSLYDWGSMDATRTVTRDFTAQLEKSQQINDLLRSSLFTSVRVFMMIKENPQDFVLEGKLELGSFRNQFELVNSWVRFGDYVYEYERDSSGKITGLKGPVNYNNFQSRTR